jgi:hypothetical protein
MEIHASEIYTPPPFWGPEHISKEELRIVLGYSPHYERRGSIRKLPKRNVLDIDLFDSDDWIEQSEKLVEKLEDSLDSIYETFVNHVFDEDGFSDIFKECIETQLGDK